MKRIILGVAVAGLAMPLAAQPGPDWRMIAADDAGEPGNTVGAAIAFVDAGSIERLADETRFTMEVRYLNQRGGQDNGLRSRLRVRCDPPQWASVETVVLRDAEPVHRAGPEDFSPVNPSTNAANVVRAICSGTLSAERVADPIARAREILGRSR
jgi:hypothetical protein